MAKYWTKLSNEILSDEVNSVHELLSIPGSNGNYYVKGDDGINFKEFFGISFRNTANCTVVNSDVTNIKIDLDPERHGYSNFISFDNCNIGNLYLGKHTFSGIEITNCKINDIIVEDCPKIDVLDIFDNSKIDNLKLERISVENFNISSSKIGKIDISNNTIVSFNIKKETSIDYAIITDCSSIQNFIVESSYLLQFTLKNTPITNAFSLKDCKKGNYEFNLLHINSFRHVFIENCNIDIKFYKLIVKPKESITFRFGGSNDSNFEFNRCYFNNEVLFQGKFDREDQNLTIIETVFKDLVLFDDDNAKSLIIIESLFQKGILLPVLDYKETTVINSSVWCNLKYQALSRHDNKKAIEYRANELKSYTNELEDETNKCQEKIVLRLNNISNKHGTSWVRGLKFTLICWAASYLLFTMSSYNFNYLNFNFSYYQGSLTNAISFLWITQGIKDLTDGLQLNPHWYNTILVVLFFVLGKILIGYGIYQTISAFRKYGKN